MNYFKYRLEIRITLNIGNLFYPKSFKNKKKIIFILFSLVQGLIYNIHIYYASANIIIKDNFFIKIARNIYRCIDHWTQKS